MLERISSKSNPQIIAASKLLKSASQRNESGLFVLEGLRLCQDAVMRSGYKPQTLFYTVGAYNKNTDVIQSLTQSAQNAYEVTDDVFAKLSDTVSPQGVLCVLKQPQRELCVKQGGRYALLCSISDPSNLGAISRTAEALGADGIIVCGERACDTYSPKALRASMGALLRLPVAVMSVDDAAVALRSNGIRLYGSVPRSDCAFISDCDFSCGGAILIGNEANGLNENELAQCDELVTIPMSGRAESLNAAAAAAILIYELTRGKQNEQRA